MDTVLASESKMWSDDFHRTQGAREVTTHMNERI